MRIFLDIVEILSKMSDGSDNFAPGSLERKAYDLLQELKAQGDKE
jgi:hypothetical protein